MGLFGLFGSKKHEETYEERRQRQQRECDHREEYLGVEVTEFCGPDRRYNVYRYCGNCGAKIWVGWETIEEHNHR